MAAKSQPDRFRKVDCGPDHTGPCDCRTAVLRAFQGMLVSGSTQPTALDVAARVYRYHHPAQSAEHAQRTVEAWISARSLH